MKVFTIGFTKKSARQFFDTLRQSAAKRVVDVRLNNVSQLAGFAKRDDLAALGRHGHSASRLFPMTRPYPRPWTTPISELLAVWNQFDVAYRDGESLFPTTQSQFEPPDCRVHGNAFDFVLHLGQPSLLLRAPHTVPQFHRCNVAPRRLVAQNQNLHRIARL